MNFNSGWQMAVIDWDRILKIERFKKRSQDLRHDNPLLEDGDVVFIIAVNMITPMNEVLNGKTPMAMVWMPAKGEYVHCPMDILHPICSEKDAIEMELKFNLKL